MKKLLTLAAAGLLGLAGSYAQTDGEVTLFPEDRSGWTISGCSEANMYLDGGFDEMKDGNPATYWHSTYSVAGSSSYEFPCPHYFVIDRGESENSINEASAPLWGFTYLPRAGKANGTVTTYSLYILDDITGLKTVYDTNANVYVDDNHASLTTFLDGKTPVASGTFDYATTELQTVEFSEAQKGRYVLFVAGGSLSATENQFASCAEFNLLLKGVVRNVTFLYPEYCGMNLTMDVTLVDGRNAANYIPAVEFFTPTGIAETGDNAIVGEQQKTFTVTGTWNIPMEFEKVYRVRLRPNNDSAKNIKYDGTNILSHYTDGTGAELAEENLWYFKYNSYTDGVLKVTMHTIKTEDSKGVTIGTGDNSIATVTDAPTTFVVKPTAWNDKAEGDFYLKHATADNWINDRDPFLSTWNSSWATSDPGSAFRLSSLTESDFVSLASCNSEADVAAAKANPTQQNLRKLNVNDADDYRMIENADAFAAFGIATEEAVNTWNTFKAGLVHDGEYTAEQSASILAAYQALVSSSANTNGAHIKLASNKVPTDFLLARLYNSEYSVGRFGSDVNANKTTWTLKPAEGGFYLYNEYAGKYINFPADDNSAVAPVTSESEAAIFVMDLYDGITARYGLKHVGDTHNHCYMHSNLVNDVVRWSKGDNSSWYVHASDEATANNEATIGANDDVADAKTFVSLIGNGVGEYTITEDPNNAFVSACEQLNALTDGASNADKHAAAAAVRAAFAGVTKTLNMLQTGRFYRLRGEYYLSSTETDARFDMVEDASGNMVETIWYYDADKKLVAFANGKVISKCDGGNYVTVLLTHANAGTVEFSESTSLGKYIVKVTTPETTRYLYHADAGHKLDAGGSAPGSSVGYHWTVEQVNWLPIPGSDKEYTAFYTPVTLKSKSADQMRANSVSVSVENATANTTAITGDIPANTPVLLEFTNGVERDANNHLVYLEIDYNAAQAQAEAAADSHFVGGIYATAKAEGTSYFTTQQQDEQVNFYALGEEENVPGFASYIEVPTELASEFYTISNPTPLAIDELSIDSKAGANVIYDLQGRRVSKAGRGLYIINGKKVLVK